MSVAGQEVIHPETGEALGGLDVLGLSRDRVLLLQDIVRGEHEGSIVYGGREKLSGTADTATRLKFLTAWLHKHRNILADYSSEQFERCLKVIYSYLEDPEQKTELKKHPELVQEARQALRDVKWAHRLRLLEKLVKNRADAFGRQFKHVQILIILTHVLGQEAEDLAAKHPQQLDKLLEHLRGVSEKPLPAPPLPEQRAPTHGGARGGGALQAAFQHDRALPGHAGALTARGRAAKLGSHACLGKTYEQPRPPHPRRAPAGRSLRTPFALPASVHHRPVQPALRLLHAPRGHRQAAPRPGAQPGGDGPGGPGGRGPGGGQDTPHRRRAPAAGGAWAVCCASWPPSSPGPTCA